MNTSHRKRHFPLAWLAVAILALSGSLLALLGDVLYVAERYNGNVVAIDTISGEGKVVASGLGEMIGIAVDCKGRIFVSRFRWGSGDTVAQVDPLAGTFRDIAAPAGVFGIFADPESDTLYVGGYWSPAVYRIQETSPNTWVVDTAVSFAESPGFVKHAFRDGNLLYVTCDGTGLWVKNLATGSLSLAVPAGGTIIAKESGGHLIVGSEGDSVYRVDASTGQVVEVYSGFNSACGIAVNPNDNSLFVAEQGGSKITRIDLASGERTTATTAVETPWQIAFAQATAPPLWLNVPVPSAGRLTIRWNGGPGIKLQQTPSLKNPDWQEVPGSDGASLLELPCAARAVFFRLVKP